MHGMAESLGDDCETSCGNFWFGKTNSLKFPAIRAIPANPCSANLYIEQLFNNTMAKTLDKKKLSMLVRVMYDNSDGLWIRELSRQSGLAVSTVHHYLNILSPLIDETTLGEKPFMRIVRLKPEVVERIDEGMTIEQILRTIEILRRIWSQVLFHAPGMDEMFGIVWNSKQLVECLKTLPGFLWQYGSVCENPSVFLISGRKRSRPGSISFE